MKALQVIAFVIVALGLAVLPAKSGPILAGKEFNLIPEARVFLDLVLEFEAFSFEGSQGSPFPVGVYMTGIYLETPLGTDYGVLSIFGRISIDLCILGSCTSFQLPTAAEAFAWWDGTKWNLAGVGIWFSSLESNQVVLFPIWGIQILPPPNDNFADRIALNGLPVSTTGSGEGSSVQFCEPQHAGVPSSDSVWWSWTAPQSTLVDIDTFGSSPNTLLAVYTGPVLGLLTEIAHDDDKGLVRFEAQAGTTYQIAVATRFPYRNIELSISLSPPAPANDQFADRIVLSGLPSSDTGTTVGASAEAGEPAHDYIPAHASVWWTWTALNTGCIEIDTIDSDFDTVLASYTGSSLDTLSLVAQNGGGSGDTVRFHAQAGTAYQIAVDGDRGEEGAVALNILECP